MTRPAGDILFPIWALFGSSFSVLFSTAEKSCAPEKGSIYGHHSTRPKIPNRALERETGKGRDGGRINAVNLTPIQWAYDAQMTRIIGCLGTFRIEPCLAFLTELVKIHFPGWILLNWGGELFFISLVVYVKGYSWEGRGRTTVRMIVVWYSPMEETY